jgi:hypothetical protein
VETPCASTPGNKECLLTPTRSIVRGGEARATALLTSKLEELHRVRFLIFSPLKALNGH